MFFPEAEDVTDDVSVKGKDSGETKEDPMVLVCFVKCLPARGSLLNTPLVPELEDP